VNKKQGAIVLATSLALLIAACSASQTEPPRPQLATTASPDAPKTKAIAPPKEAPHWTYEEAEGPAKWSTLSGEWKVCGAGRSQSPIDIDKTAKSDLPAFKAEFKPATLKIIHHEHMADAINNGHSIQVNYTEGDTLKIGDQQFQLLQYHFHSPSEHTVAGKHFPIEMHLVHKASDGQLAVIGVFVEEGRHNAAFDPIWSNLPKTKSTEYHLENVKVDVSSLLPTKTTSYRYDGSLTTPPCSEGVKWIVMTTPIQLSTQQINTFRAIMKGNNRPIQALNGRSVVTDRVAEETAAK
jgi:carbonic anhydrase